jgi:hypothetical protein
MVFGNIELVTITSSGSDIDEWGAHISSTLGEEEVRLDDEDSERSSVRAAH